MTVRFAAVSYLVTGALVALFWSFFDGRRGLTGAIAAWLLCAVPLAIVVARRGVASQKPERKLATNRGLILLPPGMLFRLGFTLAGAFLVFSAARDWLGVSFWVALLVLYQVSLGLTVSFARPTRDDAGPPA